MNKFQVDGNSASVYLCRCIHEATGGRTKFILSWILPAVILAMASAGEMVLLPGGTFVMGDANGKDDEQPREVTLSPFYIDKFEVTQKEYIELTGQNPSKFRGENHPVERVRWTDAAIFCNLRSQKEGLKPCYTPRTWKCDFSASGYRLPTEAEWEYACRAGSSGRFHFAGAEKQLGAHAWVRNNSRESTHPVGTRKPNPAGIFDLYGNVAEWCNDFYTPVLSGGLDPQGPETGSKRVLRGGSWQDRAKNISSSRRSADDPATADICQGYDTYGFRCVRRAAPGEGK